MFESLRLAECGDRGTVAREHPVLGDAASWLSRKALRCKGLRGVSFDFFIDWSSKIPRLRDEFWMKRPPSPELFPNWEEASDEEIRSALDQDDAFRDLAEFGAARGRSSVAMMFRREAEWPGQGSIRTMRLSETQEFRSSKPDLQVLMARIRNLSGESARPGKKGLYLAATTLECYLAGTDAMWPGDADLLVTDDRHNPVVLVEFKKHNKNTPLSEQRLSNYYDSREFRPDNKKYNRLAYLCVQLCEQATVPMVIVYYSTSRQIMDVKVERVEGAPRDLVGTTSEMTKMVADDPAASSRSLLEAVLRQAGVRPAPMVPA